jgi:hypothetical protein
VSGVKGGGVTTGTPGVALDEADGEGVGATGAAAGTPATIQPLTRELLVTRRGVYRGSSLLKVFAVAS